MRITLPNGLVLKRRFSPSMCTGYIASMIEFDADDIAAMRALARSNAIGFDVAMQQLESRFPERRVPLISEDAIARIMQHAKADHNAS